MQTYGLQSDEIIVVKTTRKGRNPSTTYSTYKKGVDQREAPVLGSISFKDKDIPTVIIENVGVSLHRDVLLLGCSSKRTSKLKLAGQYGKAPSSSQMRAFYSFFL